MKSCMLVALLIGSAWAQSGQAPRPERGPGKEISSGAASIGTGAAKGAAAAGMGTAKAAADLVTLHPINAGATAGRAAGAAGKDITVGAVKGTARITKGVAKGLKKLF